MVEVIERMMKLAFTQHLPHGVAIVGGTSTQRRAASIQLAQALVCEKGSACGICGACVRLANLQSEALLVIEPDGQNIKIEQAKQVLDFLSLTQVSRARIVILDPIQSLTPQAANALLKIVEEPPPNSYFFCLCPSVSLLLPTLRSRLQTFRLPYSTEKENEDAPEWMVTVESAFKGLLARRREAWEELLSFVKDKESAIGIAQQLQKLARENVVQGSPEQRLLLDWWRRFFQMEMDILANLDRTLLFENFYYQAYS